MKKRLTMALAAGALVAAMLPGVASAANPACTVVGTPIYDLFSTFDAGDLYVQINPNAVVCGGKGDDQILGDFYGTFYGGSGADEVQVLYGTFLGGAGNDFVADIVSGTFEAGLGNDYVTCQDGGTYHGGAGTDSVSTYSNGTIISVEVDEGTDYCAN